MRAWRRGTKRFAGNDGRLYLVTAHETSRYATDHGSHGAPIDTPSELRDATGRRVVERDGVYVVEATGIVITLAED
jgi:hypothetical protein